MKEEIDAAADFLSRIFLSHEKIAKEKVQEFNTILADALLLRFRDHWHESFPTKGQAYRCIRICPEEALDPLLERVCNQVGVCAGEFNLPMELTLWVDPKEVVCKFGDLKCSYHVVAKKDNSGTVNNQTDDLDIEDLVESARELYQKKQSMMAHPLNSSEIHIPGYCADGSSNRFSTALRINGTMHYNLYSTSPGSSYDGSPRGKGKSAHSPHHKRGGHNGGGFHYYGKTTGGKGFMSNGGSNGHLNSHQGSGGGGFHRNHHHHHHHHHHSHSHNPQGSTTYQNGYINGYHEDNGYPIYGDQRAVSPTKMNGGGGTTNGLPPLASMSQGSPTPEQIQQQMQHPPPMPPPMPPHLHQAYNQPPPPPPPTSDPASLSLPPPPPGSQLNQQQSQSVSSANFASGTTATSSSISSTNNSSGSSNSSSSSTNNSNNNNSHSGGKMSNHNNHNNHPSSKFQSNRGGITGSRGNRSPVKDVKQLWR